MARLADVVLTVQQTAKSDEQPARDAPEVGTANTKGSTVTPVPGPPNPTTHNHPKTGSPSPKRRSIQSSYKQSPLMPHPLTTPSERTGPPRSISFSSLPNSRVVSRTNSRTDGVHPPTEAIPIIAGPSTQPNRTYSSRPPEFNRTESQFRDALEYDDPDQREREREHLERVERRKNRDSRFEEWNPIKWLTESPRDTPKEEHPPFDIGAMSESDERRDGKLKLAHPLSAQPDGPPPKRRLNSRRSNSLPPAPKRRDSKGEGKAPRWGRLRSLLPAVITQSLSQTSQAGGSSVLAPHSVNITDELIAGGLATLMLKLWFERDEKGHRRVPILLHRLRIRISDSLHPLDGNKAVFRIECEYANGAARWVIYRQLKEFLSLHTHYTFSNAYNRNVETLPEFPKTSKRATPSDGTNGLPSLSGLPYLKFLKKEGRERGNKVGHAEFARMQREVLENYLVGLIRAVVISFPPFVYS
jgi:phospholipase D1/2